MYSIQELSDIIDKSLNQLELPQQPERLYQPIKYILSTGGKRIRPVLTLAACNAFSTTIDSAIYPALAVEVFHNFTLIHDDIMDNANMRRNKQTVHVKWDSNVAILSGDAMSIYAYQLLQKVNPSHLPNVLSVFNSFAMGICEGQQMDMDFESKSFVAQEEYIRMIELKTSILLEGALKIGAIIGGASNADVTNIGDFGRNIGIAFQLQDDLLDTYGDVSVFGKKIGGDIVANKKTILTVMALSHAKGQDLELLNSYFKLPNMDPVKKVEGVTDIYNRLNVKQHVEELIEKYHQKAITHLAKVNIAPEKKSILEELTERLMARKN